jgi:hypothetical protein
VAGMNQGAERKRTTDEVSKINGRRQNWWLTQRQDKFRGNLCTAWAAPGIKVAGP